MVEDLRSFLEWRQHTAEVRWPGSDVLHMEENDKHKGIWEAALLPRGLG
jgi:hypothetical protein